MTKIEKKIEHSQQVQKKLLKKDVEQSTKQELKAKVVKPREATLKPKVAKKQETSTDFLMKKMMQPMIDLDEALPTQP